MKLRTLAPFSKWRSGRLSQLSQLSHLSHLSLYAIALLVALVATGIGLAQVSESSSAPTEQELREAVGLAASALADMESDNFGRAVERLERVAEILPENVLPPINLAIALFRLARVDEAMLQVRRALELSPENPQALFALAMVLQQQFFDPGRSRDELERSFSDAVGRLEKAAPRDPRAPYLKARAALSADRFAAALEPLTEALRRSPDNLVLMVELLASAARAGDLDAASDALDAIEDRLNGFEPPALEISDQLRDRLFEGDVSAIRPPALVLQNILRPTELYQIGRTELDGRGGGLAMFPQLEFDPPLPKSVQGGQDIEIAFRDDTQVAGLDVLTSKGTIRSLLIEHKPRVEDLLARIETEEGQVETWRIAWSNGVATVGQVELEGQAPGPSIVYDLDQDERPDLVTAGSEAIFLSRGAGELSTGPESAVEEPLVFASAEEIPIPGSPTDLFPLDVDHDGDLDLWVATTQQDRYLQNSGGGGFLDKTSELGVLATGEADSTSAQTSRARALASADFDGDDDLDLVVASRERGLRYFDNRRSGPLIDATERVGLLETPATDAVWAADLDRDGDFDLVAWRAGGPPRLWQNQGPAKEGVFARLQPPELPLTALTAPADFDNDGDLDFLAATADRALVLIRNRPSSPSAASSADNPSGVWSAEPTGIVLPSVAVQLVTGDFDRDGDLDAAARLADGSMRFLSNQGGNKNQWLRMTLQGLNNNNAKNNTQGLFARIEVRSGGALQTLIGNGGVNHIGLGSRRQADVVRVVWTNGLAQTWQQLGTGQVLVEKQVLKGSCPFLYTWNGEEFTFHTDLMWRSTLGMMFADGSAGPHQSARDWVLIPESALQPAGDEYWLQMTDELWETIYVDRQSLLVVDYPIDRELLVDETFGLPPFPTEPPISLWQELRAPTRAVDHLGRDVLDEISRRDGQHVDQLPLTRYQGLTEGHSLSLQFDLDPRASSESDRPIALVLRGWIFPSDSSINFALSQDPTLEPTPPKLEVRQADGEWRTLRQSIGLPMGKRKTMVIALSADELLPAAGDGSGARSPIELRVSTSMQIYWDQAALAIGSPDAQAAKVTRLEPRGANLHPRGFSRLYRETDTGPHLFDYQQVETVNPFLPIVGKTTPPGDVLELLLAEDDRMVILSPGDEMTVRYSAASLPAVQPGWQRAFVLYTDGWVKDADLHTAASQSIEPLPFHGMSSYPPPISERPCSDVSQDCP